MNLSMHFVPGLFGDGSSGLLKLVVAGGVGLLARPPQVINDGGPELATDADGVAAWLADVPAGEVRQARLAGTLLSGMPVQVGLEAWGTTPTGRFLLGVDLSLRSAKGTVKDLELALLGVACAALSRESQGAALVGYDLGPVGVGYSPGTLPEQVRALLSILDQRVEVMVAAPDTAAGLEELPRYVRAPLAGMFEYRLV